MKCLILLGFVASAFALPYDLMFEPVAVAEGPGNIIQELNTLGCRELVQLVQAAGLTEQVTDNTLTVFAPSDKAIGMLPKHVVEYLGKNKTALTELLMYHAIPDMKIVSSSLYNDETVASADMMMDKIRANVYGMTTMKTVTVDGSKVVVANHEASNGVIHVIDRVMFPIPTRNIAEYLMRDNMYFSTLLDAVKAADLTDAFTGPGPLTLFAPDNAAFKKLPPGALDALLKDKKKLVEVLSYHVAMGTIYAAGLTPEIKTLTGKDLKVSMMEGHVMMNNAHVDYADRKVTNGVIHVIDQVLMPPMMLMELMAAPAAPGNILEEAEKLGLKTLISLVKAAGLEDDVTTNTLTVMAPTDEAFNKLPKSILEYLGKNKTALMEVLMFHAIPDAQVMSKDLKNDELVASADPMSDNIRFNIYMNMNRKIVTSDGARVVMADHMASNGVIHVIDRVMFPIPTTNIVDWLSARSTYFSTLIDAAKDAGLADTLMGMGPFTLFAPDDAAFKKIPKATLAALLKDKMKLAAVLKYHVLPQTLYSAGIENKSYMTAEGGMVRIDKREERGEARVMINGKAMVKYADASATNGVVHVIDTVLMPPMW